MLNTPSNTRPSITAPPQTTALKTFIQLGQAQKNVYNSVYIRVTDLETCWWGGLTIVLSLCSDILPYSYQCECTCVSTACSAPQAAELPVSSITLGATSKIANIHPGLSPASLSVYHSNRNPGGHSWGVGVRPSWLQQGYWGRWFICGVLYHWVQTSIYHHKDETSASAWSINIKLMLTQPFSYCLWHPVAQSTFVMTTFLSALHHSPHEVITSPRSKEELDLCNVPLLYRLTAGHTYHTTSEFYTCW